MPEHQTKIILEKQFPIVNIVESIKSDFCPLLTLQNGVCVVSGSEDMSIYIFDAQRQQTCINKLQGHSGIVYDVSWNYDETLLASCDSTGTVIIWKRINKVLDY